jgi:hypothetical protein
VSVNGPIQYTASPGLTVARTNATINYAPEFNSLRSGTSNYISCTGTNTMTCVPTGATFVAHELGRVYNMVVATTNSTTTPTIDIDGAGSLAAKTLVTQTGAALTASQLVVGVHYVAKDVGTNIAVTFPTAAGAASHVKKCYVPGLTNTTSSSTLLATSGTLTVAVGDVLRVTALLHTVGTDISRWSFNLGSTVVVPLWAVGVGGEDVMAVAIITITSTSEYYASINATRPGGAGVQVVGSAGTGGTYTGSQALEIYGSFGAPTGSTASVKNFCIEQLPATP